MSRSDESVSRIARLKELDWRPAVPILVLLGLYLLYMPSSAPADFRSLELYQQITALAALPTIFCSIYWFCKTNDLWEEQTQEERILDE